VTDDGPAAAPRRRPAPPEPSVDELQADATYATERLALYRRKILLGRGEPQRLAELERISTAAAGRLRRARDRGRTAR
jgi:hypothetical protein